MVQVKPFRAYRYSPSKVKDYSKVVAPPYDIIKGDAVDFYQGLSEYNIAWITKSKPMPGDTEHNNQYTRAGERLRKWLQEGVLVPDSKDSYYVYGQDFEIAGKRYFRFGFIGLLELEEFGRQAPERAPFTGVLQHEETLPKDIQDRLNLCRQTFMQFGLIFVIYPDPERRVDRILEREMKKSPIVDITDNEGVRHRIWAVTGKAEIDAIGTAMQDKYVVIADGHHRYKTALALRDENPDLESAKYRMVVFVNMENPGLIILPTHRVVQNLPDFDVEKMMKRATEYFDVDAFDKKEDMFSRMSQEFDRNGHCFGMFVNDGKFYTLRLKDPKAMDKVLPGKSEDLKSLDVTILHSLILDRVLGIGKDKLAEGTMSGGGYVTYLKGTPSAVDEALEMVKKGANAAFFLNPTRVREVEAVSRRFEVMPQKSTYFVPKVWTGFTMNRLK
ncbi:MAG: DUF1015 domain-containing protein [Candidatus Thorarchaeota archaeon]